MTDKVQKILSEIATRKLCTMDEHMAFYNDKAKEDYRFLSEIEELIKALQEEPVSEEIWEASKQYALRQVLASTDTEMSEQAYLDLRLFSGFELAVAHKDGANWQKNLNKKDFELLKEWFEDISEKCEHLTSGNVSHNGKMIRGYARNSAEYIKTDLL